MCVCVCVCVCVSLRTEYFEQEGGTLVRHHAKRVLPLLCARISDQAGAHRVSCTFVVIQHVLLLVIADRGQVCLPRLEAALDAMTAFTRAAGPPPRFPSKPVTVAIHFSYLSLWRASLTPQAE